MRSEFDEDRHEILRDKFLPNIPSTMKPRKKQRIERESKPEKPTSKRDRVKELSPVESEDSLEDEGLDDVIQDEDGDVDFGGIASYPHTVTDVR